MSLRHLLAIGFRTCVLWGDTSNSVILFSRQNSRTHVLVFVPQIFTTNKIVKNYNLVNLWYFVCIAACYDCNILLLSPLLVIWEVFSQRKVSFVRILLYALWALSKKWKYFYVFQAKNLRATSVLHIATAVARGWRSAFQRPRLDCLLRNIRNRPVVAVLGIFLLLNKWIISFISTKLKTAHPTWIGISRNPF